MLALSCGKSKKGAPISQREQQIEEQPKEELIDQDSLFCSKMIETILEEGRKWSVNFNFQKQDWKIKDTNWGDFDFAPNLQKEVHYSSTGVTNEFINIDYYLYKTEEEAQEFLDDYKYALDCQDEELYRQHLQRSKVKSDGFMKMTSCLFRQAKTVFYITVDNRLDHIVIRAMDRFIVGENIDENKIIRNKGENNY